MNKTDNKARTFIYRKAGISDIQVVTELLCELYENHGFEELFVENKELLEDKSQVFFIAYDDKNPIGICHGAIRHEYVNGKTCDGAVGYLEAVYVRPHFRFRGVASTLVKNCEQWVGQNNCTEFISDCLLDNLESYKFHNNIGFIETERCIFFRKTLN